MELLLVLVVIAVALAFDFTNGFHDAANAIATSVFTRALTPRIALSMAAVCNLLGAFLGTGVATVIGFGIVDVGLGHAGLLVVLAALIGAIGWNLTTWRFGLPSSSTGALLGGLAGAGLAAGARLHWDVVLVAVVVPMVVSPLTGAALGYLATAAVLHGVRDKAPGPTNRRFRMLQTVSAAAVALGHGLQDAQKTMGVIVLALVAGGLQTGRDIPWWVTLLAALAISAGTYCGGWRIIRTLGRRVAQVDPARGFVAETVASVVLYVAALAFNAPVSTTQVMASAVMGAAATKRRSAVRWRVVRSMLVAWVLTMPAAAVLGALVCLGLRSFL
ncbi:inorganic phosphate transporter [Kineococcus rhizosphaerae]|uniref:PiT family inorganic phosphate transporter n=1 Tax=Kineococcus rhizosphaerae TaxID=559628 RepID=A0A2T0QY47_9ACTN|nr:inorganic phosphate transporter [Kineococcus rhizosphaerae]PRY11142.1 PiT family inorganic phosphate transporter [Kineococcus rhizosphaerae]